MALLDENFDATQVKPYDETIFFKEAAIKKYDEMLQNIRGAVNGSRNDTLNACAYVIGRMVGAGIFDMETSRRDLALAASMLGISAWEYQQTINRALSNGSSNPWIMGSDAGDAWKRDLSSEVRTQTHFEFAPPINNTLAKEKAVKTDIAVSTYECSSVVVGTRGQFYLNNRGITTIPNNVRYSSSFHGLVFPLTLPDGTITAIQRIYINRDNTVVVERHTNDDGTVDERKKKLTNGDMKNSMIVFNGKQGPYILVDGPEDGLSAHQATGLTVFAACSKGRFRWAADHMQSGSVLFAVRDADGTDGSEYASAVKAFAAKGITAIWVDPPPGAKDVNDVTKSAGDVGVEQWLSSAWKVNFGHDITPEAKRSSAPPAAAQAETSEPESTEPPPGSLPEPMGLVKDIRDYIESTAIYSHPALALGAALITVGTLAARRYGFERNIRTNLYVLGLAPSSSGKNHPLNMVTRMLTDAGYGHLMGGSVPASGAAVISRVMTEPVTTYAIDEFGMLLRSMSDPKTAAHLREVTKVWTELYTASAHIYADKDRADRKMNVPRLVHQPALSVFGLTNCTHVWAAVTPDSITDGSLARFLVIETSESFPMPSSNDSVYESASMATPEWLLERMRRVCTDGNGVGAGNMCNEGTGCVPSIRPIIATDEVKAIFRQLMVEETMLKRQHEAAGLSAIYGRMVEQSKKLALIHAIGRDTTFCKIERCDAEWAIATVRELTGRLVNNLVKNVAKNDHERGVKDLLKIIRDHKKWMSKSTITKRSHWLKTKDRNDLLDDLVSSGQIEVKTDTSHLGRPTIMYRYVPKKRSQETDD